MTFSSLTEMGGSVGNVVALAVLIVLGLVAYRIRARPGGPMMFGLQHPRIALSLAFLMLVLAVSYSISETLGVLPDELRPEFREYLVRVFGVAFLGGVVVAIDGYVRRPRGARAAAANLRSMGTYAWVGALLFPVLMALGELFNPVDMPWSGTPGIVLISGLFAPVFILWSVTAFFFRSTIPSVPEVATTFPDGLDKDWTE